MSNKFIKIQLEDATNIPKKEGMYDLIKDNYWALTAHNELLISKNGGRFCNRNENLVKKFVAGNSNSPAVKVIYLENVWLPYCD